MLLEQGEAGECVLRATAGISIVLAELVERDSDFFFCKLVPLRQSV